MAAAPAPLNKVPGGGSRALTALLAAWFLLVVYGASGSQNASYPKKRAAVVSAVVVVLIVGFVGEVAPELAVGFASLLLVAMLAAGPANGLRIIGEIPHNLMGAKA